MKGCIRCEHREDKADRVLPHRAVVNNRDYWMGEYRVVCAESHEGCHIFMEPPGASTYARDSFIQQLIEREFGRVQPQQPQITEQLCSEWGRFFV